MSPLLFYQLHLSVSFEIGAFENRLKQLHAADFPTDAASSFIGRLIRDLAEQRSRLRKIVKDFPHDSRGAVDRLRSEQRKLILRLPRIADLENAQTRRVPWSLVPSIESFARELLPGRLLLTSGAEEFNYSISWSPKTARRTKPYAVLSVPAIHRIDAFFHVLVGHELFHPTLEEFLDQEQYTVVRGLRARCRGYLRAQPLVAPTSEKARLDQMLEQVRYIWRRAMEELMCDMGCVLLFGPAAVLANVAFFLGSNFDEVPSGPDYYPPFRYRLRAMLRYGFSRSWGRRELQALLASLASSPDLADVARALEKHWQAIVEESKYTEDRTAISSKVPCKIAYAHVAPLLDRAWQHVKSVVGEGSPLPWTKSYQEVPAHLRSLGLLVPCGELRGGDRVPRPASATTAVVLAAWMNELRERGDGISSFARDLQHRYMRACRLFLKSMEDAELKRTVGRSLQLRGRGGGG